MKSNWKSSKTFGLPAIALLLAFFYAITTARADMEPTILADGQVVAVDDGRTLEVSMPKGTQKVQLVVFAPTGSLPYSEESKIELSDICLNKRVSAFVFGDRDATSGARPGIITLGNKNGQDVGSMMLARGAALSVGTQHTDLPMAWDEFEAWAKANRYGIWALPPEQLQHILDARQQQLEDKERLWGQKQPAPPGTKKIAAPQGDSLGGDWYSGRPRADRVCFIFYDAHYRWDTDLQRMAEKGNAAAQRKLGFVYLWGYNVKKNEDEGLKWMRQAAENGDERARLYMGEIDEQNSARWFHMVADTTSPWAAQAYCELERIYRRGEGVKRDYTESYFWASLSYAMDANAYGLLAYEQDNADEAAKHLTPEQKAAADNRIKGWLKDHPLLITCPPWRSSYGAAKCQTYVP